jgi:xanthine dehydrogenase molybdopterin-binding subunit B
MHLVRGEARRAIERAPHRIKGSFDVGGQEQFYLEGQISYAIPRENDGMLVHCSTQHPSEMQHLVAHALGCTRTTCRWSAGAWAAASAARSRSRRCSPASPRWPRAS